MGFLYTLVVIFVLCLSFLKEQAAEEVVFPLNEPKAQIRGNVFKTNLGTLYYAFQDIPYAVPPLGENRFAEPIPHPGWRGILNTTKNDKVCMQLLVVGTEDCLVLNVYSPVRNSDMKIPVLFWIHGGAFEIGSGRYSSHNPNHFIDAGIVVVTINYRLGPFGFLTTEDGVVPGNLGLKDQLLALKWVNKNIAVFGGDPKKVTIAGQSAGSISCSYHIASQKSTGLYRAAIMESGTALIHGSYIDHARNYSFQLGKLLDKNLTTNDSRELLKVLRKASPNEILLAALGVQSIGNQVGILVNLIWAVVIENKNNANALITAPMHESFKKGNFDKVPILLGYTSEEILTFIFDVDIIKKNAAILDTNPANLIDSKWNISEKNQHIVGEKLKKLYTNTTFYQDLASFVSFSSEIGFVNPTVRQADLTSKFVPVYLYQFSFKGSAHDFISANISNVDGVGHAEELFYMWQPYTQNHSDILNSKRLVTMWAHFLWDLNPTLAADSTLGIPVWPRVQSDNLQYMDINNTLRIKKNPKRYNEVKDIVDKYMQPPFNVY